MSTSWMLLMILLFFSLVCMYLYLRDPVWKSSISPTEFHREMLVFIRVPKTASELFVLLLQWLQGIDQFRHYRLQNTVDRRFTDREQEVMFQDIKAMMEASETGIPVSLDRHIFFTDFQSALPFVTVHYFSVIRDPVDRIISQFYYDRVTPRPELPVPSHLTVHKPKYSFEYLSLEECLAASHPECTYITGHQYELAIPYFCGHEHYCTELNNDKALQQAKRNVERYFPVVGVLEHFNCTLQAAQRHLPTFFRNISTLYYQELLEPKKNKNPTRPRHLGEDLMASLKRNLTLEYQFYDFIQRRLLHQCNNIDNFTK